MNNSNSCFNLASSKYRKISLFAKYKQRHIHVTYILKHKAGMWIFLNKTRFASKILQKMTYPTGVPRTPRQWPSKNGKDTLYHPIPSEKLALFLQPETLRNVFNFEKPTFGTAGLFSLSPDLPLYVLVKRSGYENSSVHCDKQGICSVHKIRIKGFLSASSSRHQTKILPSFESLITPGPLFEVSGEVRLF